MRREITCQECGYQGPDGHECDKTDPVAVVTRTILKRYVQILEKYPFEAKYSSKYLLRMCDVAIYNYDLWPIDKLSRWLGFIQGVMIANGCTDVDSQRDYSRELFHAAYIQKGIKVPASVGVE